MKIVIFGLTISSSWGNGHATIWRGLCRELINHGHDVVFFERDVPYYAAHRDLQQIPGGTLRLYQNWGDVRPTAQRQINDADVAITTSYCPNAIEASELIWDSPGLRVFYDLDTPVTFARLHRGERVPYLHPNGLSEFDLVLSFTGGASLRALEVELGARSVAALYGSVDPEIHRRIPPRDDYRAALSYLGTYSEDRQSALNDLFIEPARRSPERRFFMAGAQYPMEFPWTPNIFFARHLPPADHAAFFSSSDITLNVTRAPMREMGWCPSGRLFEAAACQTPVITDCWQGLEDFFVPGEEILVARAAEDVLHALELSDAELTTIGRAARERTLAEHTATQRADQFEQIVQRAQTREMAAA
jgi:spore maturation protein CgeB